MPPHVVLVAGPNGAGKSSFARHLIRQDPREYAFLNADDIARDLTTQGVRLPDLDSLAGRELMRRLAVLISQRRDIMIETTLTGRTYAKHIPEWCGLGYWTVLHYLRLPDVDASIARVHRRVASGGHGIPESVLRRRFKRSLENFALLYKPIVDDWFLYDSIEGDFVLVDEGIRS